MAEIFHLITLQKNFLAMQCKNMYMYVSCILLTCSLFNVSSVSIAFFSAASTFTPTLCCSVNDVLSFSLAAANCDSNWLT